MKLLALVAVALLFPQEKNEAEVLPGSFELRASSFQQGKRDGEEKYEAEALFKKMEEKLAKAKTLQCKVEGIVEPIKLRLTGALWLGEGNFVRLELVGRSEEATRLGTVISDGQGMRIAADDTARSLAAPANIGRALRLWFARAGYWSSINAAGAPVTEYANEYSASHFTLGAKEKVGDREGQAVEFALKPQGNRLRSEITVTVWIDLKTHLPLKRTVTTQGDSFEMGETTVVREIYSDFEMDEKLDPAKFELSKVKK